MKRITFVFFSVLLFCTAVLFSCQKEYSIELPTTDSAAGSLQDSTGNCLGDSVYGTFYNGILPGSDTDYVQIKVNVASIGAYSIHTDLQNGFEFADSGFFSTTGINIIKLKPIGTPIVHNATVFTVAFDSSSCLFTVNVSDSTGHSGGGSSGTAVFTLDGAPGACTNAVVNGTYFAATALGSTNTVTLPVTVTKIGTYTLTTNTVNGYKFSGSGTFTSTGTQTITLAGSGTPVKSETDALQPQEGSSYCSFDVNVAPSAAPAVFTLAGDPGACTSPVVNGNYSINTALTANNTVALNVNVTTAGSYSIATSTVNGFSFTASGVFTTTGIQSVILTGTGTPIAAGTTTLTPLAGTSSCTFNITVSAAAPGILTCNIDGVAKTFNDNATATYQVANGNDLFISGFVSAGTSTEELSVDVNNYQGAAITTGSYQNTFNSVLTTFFQPGCAWTDPVSNTIWSPEFDLSNAANWDPFTINITSLTSTNVQGTFSGTIRNVLQGGTITKSVTNGVFNVPIH